MCCWKRNCVMNDTPITFCHSNCGIIGMASRADSGTGVGEAFSSVQTLYLIYLANTFYLHFILFTHFMTIVCEFRHACAQHGCGSGQKTTLWSRLPSSTNGSGTELRSPDSAGKCFDSLSHRASSCSAEDDF